MRYGARMRTTMLAFLLASLFLASAAIAEPAVTRCYAGNQTAKIGTIAKTFREVIQRTLDPAASEIRQHGWLSRDPSREVVLLIKVDVKAATFAFDDPELGARGTGTLEGKAWHWTSMTQKVTKDTVELVGTTKIDGDHLRQHGEIHKGDKLIGAFDGDLVVFDCAKLADERAALAKP
jgi:hypothetical protein